MTFEEFVQQLQKAIREDKTKGCWQRGLSCLNVNNWKTVRDVPDDKRETFLSLVKREGAQGEDLRIEVDNG